MEDDGIVLDMVIATKNSPPRTVVCKKNGNGIVVCTITDLATNRRLAEFKVSHDLLQDIPDLLKMYIP